MSEEIVVPADSGAGVVVEVDPVEQEARTQGWVSKEEWEAQGKDPSDHRSAKEFKDRGELFRTIHNLKKDNQQTRAALDSLAKHHQHVYENAFIEADRKLRLEKREAIRQGDLERAEEIDTVREQKKTQHEQQAGQFQKEQQMARTFQNNPPELDAWLVRNTWYEQDFELKEEADTAGRIYLRKGGDPQNLLAHVEKKIKDRYPEKFGITPRKAAPSAVAEPARQGVRKSTAGDEASLGELELKIMNDIVRSGVMTKEQWIKEYKGRP